MFPLFCFHMPTFKKQERICSKKFLDKLFLEGKTMLVYPLKFNYLEISAEDNSPCQVVFIVPKKRFRKAYKRNLQKRRMREAYRLLKDDNYKNIINKNIQLIISISYIANEILPFDLIFSQMKKGLFEINKHWQVTN
jgi:ribonuclease P protein component